MADKFKSADALGITDGERKWLIRTMRMLAAMRVDSTRKVNGWNLAFDMGDILYRNRDLDKGDLCGTAGCIKGWMGCLAIANKDRAALPDLLDNPVNSWMNSDALDPLFFPDHAIYSKVTPRIAAAAIARFLRGKPVRWGRAETK